MLSSFFCIYNGRNQLHKNIWHFFLYAGFEPHNYKSIMNNSFVYAKRRVNSDNNTSHLCVETNCNKFFFSYNIADTKLVFVVFHIITIQLLRDSTNSAFFIVENPLIPFSLAKARSSLTVNSLIVFFC